MSPFVHLVSHRGGGSEWHVSERNQELQVLELYTGKDFARKVLLACLCWPDPEATWEYLIVVMSLSADLPWRDRALTVAHAAHHILNQANGIYRPKGIQDGGA